MDEEVEFSGPEEGDVTTEDHRHFYQYNKLWLDEAVALWRANLIYFQQGPLLPEEES